MFLKRLALLCLIAVSGALILLAGPRMMAGFELSGEQDTVRRIRGAGEVTVAAVNQAIATRRAAAKWDPGPRAQAELGEMLLTLAALEHPAAEDLRPQLAEESLENLVEDRTQPLHVGLAHRADPRTGISHLDLPGLESASPGTLPQDRVALPERTLVATPAGQKIVFHVEHAPIEESTTLLGHAVDQLVRTRFEADHRTGSDQAGDTGGLAIHPRLEPALAAGQAQSALPVISEAEPAKHRETRTADPAQRIAYAAAERTTVREQVGGFEDARLSGTIRADERTPAAAQIEAEVLDETQVADPQLSEHHAQALSENTGPAHPSIRGPRDDHDRSAQSRSGMTTCRVSSESTLRSRQLDCASRRLSTISSPLRAASASIR